MSDIIDAGKSPDVTEFDSPLSRPDVRFRPAQAVSFDEDIPWILNQYKQRVGAVAVSLVVAYKDGRNAEIIFATTSEDDTGHPQNRASGLAKQSQANPFDAFAPNIWWTEPVPDAGHLCLATSLARDEDSCVIVKAFWPNDDPLDRSLSEAAAARFHAVLTGYFKLWLRDRSSRRQLELIIAALDCTQSGVAILNKKGKIVHENAKARQLLAQRDGLERQEGGLGTANLLERARVNLAIEEALTDSEGSFRKTILVRRRDSDQPLIISVGSIAMAGKDCKDPAAIVQIFSPASAPDIFTEPVCAWFGLSAMETRIAQSLLTGMSVPSMALQEEVKEATIRTYLKNIFRKTGTNTQAGLVRLLMCNTTRLFQ